MRPVFLTGERLYLRAMVAADKEHAVAWFDEVFPINAAGAERVLKDDHRGGTSRLAIVRTEDEVIVGSVQVVSRDGHRTCRLAFHMAPWLPDADAVRAQALRVVVPWLRDQMELMVVTVPVPADQAETIAAAEALGMRLGVRFREPVARPGGRVDLLIYQALNPRWEVRDA
jgi:RimJ/RimL family protein N-acetyltransferase